MDAISGKRIVEYVRTRKTAFLNAPSVAAGPPGCYTFSKRRRSYGCTEIRRIHCRDAQSPRPHPGRPGRAAPRHRQGRQPVGAGSFP